MIPLAGVGDEAIVCSLRHDSVSDRIHEWIRLLAPARERVPISNGVRVVFDRQVDVAALAGLAADEQMCCSFFRFDIGIGSREVTLDVTGPDESRRAISALFGAA